MFGPPGRAYVYLIYGMYHCLNAVTEPEGRGGAVLIRAAQPLLGLETMWRARFPQTDVPTTFADERLAARIASGPGKLCRALEITRDGENGTPLYDGGLMIVRQIDLDGDAAEAAQLSDTPRLEACGDLDIIEDGRIGISRSTDTPWRFTIAESRFVSRRPDPALRPRRYAPR
jgi:DNA-3-methyladenine glycosylase